MIISNTQVCGFQFTEDAEGPDYSKVIWKIIAQVMHNARPLLKGTLTGTTNHENNKET